MKDDEVSLLCRDLALLGPVRITLSLPSRALQSHTAPASGETFQVVLTCHLLGDVSLSWDTGSFNWHRKVALRRQLFFRAGVLMLHVNK